MYKLSFIINKKGEKNDLPKNNNGNKNITKFKSKMRSSMKEVKELLKTSKTSNF